MSKHDAIKILMAKGKGVPALSGPVAWLRTMHLTPFLVIKMCCKQECHGRHWPWQGYWQGYGLPARAHQILSQQAL
jgi:hypothetical protein